MNTSKRSPNVFTRQSVRKALRCWDNLEELGAHPLARLKVVEKRHRARNRSDSLPERGLSLRDVLRAAIREQRPGPSDPDYHDRRWRSYVILKEEFTEGRDPEYLALQMEKISSRTYQRAKGLAIDELASTLQQWEDEQQHDIPAPKTREVLFLAHPKPPYRLVGRYAMLQELKAELLNDTNASLCALSGLPGVGKTALAVELAHDHEVLERFPDGVLWIDLGREPDVLSLLGTWAVALGTPLERLADLDSEVDRARAVHQAIGMRRMLLVIDDAWQLDAALSFRVGGPNCAHLLTTRSPDIARDFAEKGALVVEQLSEAGGLLLFNQLAPDVAEVNPQATQELIHAVGGLPLAIILMAKYARREASKGSTPLQLALHRLKEAQKRLEIAQPQLLVSSHPSLPAGVSLSLRAAIEISDEALGDSARRAFYALSVFPPKSNTFSREAVAVITGESTQVLEELSASGLLEPYGPNRYTVHQTIADYVRLKPAPASTHERFVTYFVNYVEAHEKDLNALSVEEQNVLAALETGLTLAMEGAFLRGVMAIYPYLRMSGLYRVAHTWLKRAEQVARRVKDSVQLVKILGALGRINERLGDYEQAEQVYKEGLGLAQELGQRESTCTFLYRLGMLSLQLGDYEESEVHFQRSLEIARRMETPEVIGKALSAQASLAFHRGEFDRAMIYLREGLELAYVQEDLERVIDLLSNLGAIEQRRGAYDKAQGYLLEGLKLAQEIGYQEGISNLYISLGAVAGSRGLYEDAELYYKKGLVLAREWGYTENVCFLLVNLGAIVGEQGKYDLEEAYYQEALPLARQLGHYERLCHVLLNLGAVTTDRGFYDRAEGYLQEGIAIAREANERMLTCLLLNELGRLYLKRRDWRAAQAVYAEAGEIASRSDMQPCKAEALFGLAQVSFAQGDAGRASLLAQESLSIFRKTGHAGIDEVQAWLDGLPQQVAS